MTLSNWARLTPEEVSKQMSFVEGDKSWAYKADQNHSMAAKQTEGVAYLCRLLHKHGLALLADEVGMGKTFQAIGIIRLLLQEKPNAKILVIAPNSVICHQWQREFDTFARSHWRGDSRESINVAEPQSKLEDMVSLVKRGLHHVYFTTIYSLSGLVKSEENDIGKVAQAELEAMRLKDEVMGELKQQGFDLLVIDEAHYLRNKDGGSQKVAAAKAFFGERHNALAKKVLLMTATPTHSSINDVANILSYFAPESELKNTLTKTFYDASELLTKYGLRRHRLLEGASGRHYTKQHYRKEIAHPVSFSGNQNAELFFGLYQRQLVKEVQAKGANRQFLYGYLEGFESFGEQDNQSQQINGIDQCSSGEGDADSFSRAQDTPLLNRLSREYYDCFEQFPEHPKYKALVDHFVPNELSHIELDNIKHLVFVRRIPSVRELTKRVNSRYDNVFGARISTALKLSNERQKEWQKTKWSRVWLNNYFNKIESPDELELASDEEEDEMDIDLTNDGDNYLRSRITELFVVKPLNSSVLNETRNTVCTNIALRFRTSESIFSMFLEPALDFWQKEYEYSWEVQSGERKRATYKVAAYHQRAERHSFDGAEFKEVAGEKKEKLQTIWQYLVELLDDQEQNILKGWEAVKKEHFANYFKTGVLFASPVMVELFCWLYSFDNDKSLHNRSDNAYTRYTGFLQYTKNRLSDSMLFWYFKAAIITFEAVCKLASEKQQEKKWQALKNNTSPAAFASSESSNRDNLQLGFNTPFYPNVLVATSVFQEGVNLHLQCNEVHHYGLAGSPGSHEQRVGRIDRLFGKVNRQYIEKEQSELRINFPYLEHSFDEDQLASFLERKVKAESKLDKCLMDDADSRIGTEKVHDWKEYLKQPELETGHGVKDPYPAKFD